MKLFMTDGRTDVGHEWNSKLGTVSQTTREAESR